MYLLLTAIHLHISISPFLKVTRLKKKHVHLLFKIRTFQIYSQKHRNNGFFLHKGNNKWKIVKVGKTLTHNTLINPGDFFGEEEIISGQARRQKLVAEEDSLCMCLNKDEFLNVFDAQSVVKFQKNFHKKAQNREDLIKFELEKQEQEKRKRVKRFQFFTCRVIFNFMKKKIYI